MIEVARGLLWIYEKLANDATLAGLVDDRIYDGIAPEGAAFPYVIYNFQAGADTVVVGAARVLNSGLYLVKAVAETQSYSGPAEIADRIDDLLQAASGAADDGLILGANREQPIMYVEAVDTIQFRHVGGLYRIITQEL
jgi:hypothetical protein